MSTTSPGARRQRADAQRNRERLLLAAKAAFGALGPDVGVAEIARRAGVGQATLFRHFASKDELLFDVLDRELESFEALLGECVAEPDPWVALERFLTRASEAFATDRSFFEAAKTVIPGSAERFEARIAPIQRDVEVLFRRAQQAGVLRDDVVPHDIGPLLTAAAQAVQLHNFPHRPQLWRRYLGILLDGLRPAAATPLPEPPPSVEDIERAKRGC